MEFIAPLDALFLLAESRRLALENALARALGTPIELKVEVRAAAAVTTAPGVPPEIADEAVSPAELDARRAVEKVRAAQASIETDPVVRAFREQFGANPRPGSIHPLDS